MSWKDQSQNEYPHDVRYCQGKPMYDKRGATSAANKRYHQDHIRLRIYQHGNHWHLTKQLETRS